MTTGNPLADALRLLSDPTVRRLVASTPRAAEIYQTVRRAARGDREAWDWLRREGWAEALDLAVPGAGVAAQQAVAAARAVATGNVVEGEWREVVPETLPWQRFKDWIAGRRWGAFVALGPRGSGKTVLALRLAQVWHDRLDWPAEVVNVYPDDAPAFVRRVSAKRFAGRLRALTRYLDLDDYSADENAAGGEGAVGGEGEEAENVEVADISQLQRRIVVVDEASLVGTGLGKQRGRDMLQAIMAQSRHLEWLIVYVAQTTRMLPLSLLGTADAVLVKRPAGGESWTDRPDTPEVERLWERTAAAYTALRQSPYWPELADDRKWTYAECPDLYGRPWQGMIPVQPPMEV